MSQLAIFQVMMPAPGDESPGAGALFLPEKEHDDQDGQDDPGASVHADMAAHLGSTSPSVRYHDPFEGYIDRSNTEAIFWEPPCNFSDEDC